MTEIRPASSDDAHALAELRWAFRTAHYRRDKAVESHDEFVKRCAEWMARELASPEGWRAWVAIRDGRVAGQIWASLIHKLPNPAAESERHAYVSNLFVEPEARGGVGTRLLETVLAWARSNDADRVILWPSARSVSLYGRHGFTRGGDLMELTIHSTTAR